MPREILLICVTSIALENFPFFLFSEDKFSFYYAGLRDQAQVFGLLSHHCHV